jgi:PASTA domain
MTAPHVSTLTGSMRTLITPRTELGFNFFDTTHAVALTVVFEPDYSAATLTAGWPAVTFDNSAPLARATESLTISLANTPYGPFEPDPGHLMFRVLLRLDFSPDPWFARRDQQVEMKLSTRMEDLARNQLVDPGACQRLWAVEGFPELGMVGAAEFYTTDFFLSIRHDWEVAVIVDGELDPLPPRHRTPTPHTTVPDVRELDRDTADAQLRDAGLLPAHIPLNADANSWVRHQTPAAGQTVDMGSVVTLQLQAASPL